MWLILHMDSQVIFRVWFPTRVEIVADDYVLNKFKTPTIAPQACSRPLYQSTPLRVVADFGGKNLERIEGVDISEISTLSSSDSSVIQITNGTAQVETPSCWIHPVMTLMYCVSGICTLFAA